VSKVVLCEGFFDEAVLSRLIAVNKLDITIEVYKGKNRLKPFMKTRRQSSDYGAITTLAVTRDADASAENAFKSVRDTLKGLDILPPSENETFLEGSPKVGVFIVGHAGQGSIEDLCLASVGDRPEFPCVERYFQCTKRESHSKSRAWVWMASYPDFEFSVRKVGTGKKGLDYWNWNHPVFDPLKTFLKAM
jgi:hypothetical protein